MEEPQQDLQTAAPPTAADEFVDFVAVGTRASGPFRCVACGWMLVAFGILTRCPGCGDGLWERCEWSPLGVARRLRAH